MWQRSHIWQVKRKRAALKRAHSGEVTDSEEDSEEDASTDEEEEEKVRKALAAGGATSLKAKTS